LSFRPALLAVFCAALALAQTGLREAARLDSEGRCAESEPFYRAALAAPDPSPALLNNAGNHYLICGQPEKARAYFEELLRSSPNHPNANLQLARIAAGEKQGARALTHLARVKESGPAVDLLRAEALHLAGQEDEAGALLAGLTKQAAGDPALSFALGTLHARLGQYRRAETAFHTALADRPHDFDVLLSYGRAAARAGSHERARAALETALKVGPGDTNALTELGLLNAAAGDYTRAVYFLAQARQSAPDRPDILLALARAAEDAGFYGDAALAYGDYLRLQPGDTTARRDRARVLGHTGGRLDEGLREMKAYIAAHPADPVGHFNLAQFTWRSDPEASLAQLATAVHLDPHFAPAHVSRAWLLHRLGRGEDAIPHLQAALETAPDNVRALDLLGLVHLSLGEPQKAEPPLRRALAIAPRDAEVLLHLGRTLMALDRQEEAQRFLDLYRETRPARQRDPRREPAMIELATLPEAERRAREIERFRSLSRSRPDDPVLQAGLASLLLAGGTAREAADEFRRLLTLNADAQVLEQAGRALLHAAEFQLAREFLERAAASRPEARLDLAAALFHTAGPPAALEALAGIPDHGSNPGAILLKARILDAAGRTAEAREALNEGLAGTAPPPEFVPPAALLLARYGGRQEALEVLERTARTAPDNAEVALAHAIVLVLLGHGPDAEKALKTIESRWPEWDRPYVVHGLVLEHAGRKLEAAGKLRTATALGSGDPAAECALSRLAGQPATGPQCACAADLERWLLSSCDSL
jgi:Flp pilus assembly protein TadD